MEEGRIKIVVDDAIPFISGVFEPYADVVYKVGREISREDLFDAQALVIRTRTKCDAALLDGTKVKFIATATIGTDHIDHDYCDKAGIDEQTALNMGNAFAAGMGNMEGTCGALIGAGMVLGLSGKSKAEIIQGMRRIMNNFQERNGATQCKLLKGIESGKVLRECPDCVADACEFLEEVLDAD
jgi:C_GCAxxG_C_C family probable redox protein